MAPVLSWRPGHRQENRTKVLIAGTAILTRLLPPTLLLWLLKLTKAGDTTAISLLRSWLQPQLLCDTQWTCSFLAHFLPKDRQRGSPRRCRTRPNRLSYSSFSVLVFWKKKAPYSADNPSTQQGGSATVILNAFLKTPSEPEFWLHWHLTNHIKVLTYAVFLFLLPPVILASDVTVAYFLIKDFDIFKPLFISYLGNIQRKTTQMGK